MNQLLEKRWHMMIDLRLSSRVFDFPEAGVALVHISSIP